ncbi:MAG: urease accessory protein UreD [Rhodobacterales bacterium]
MTAQRARGTLWLAAKQGAAAGTSALADLRHSGCLKALFPRGPRDRLSAVFVNTSGGITGGDDLRIEATVTSGARLSLTSQAAERIYRSSHGAPGIVRTQVSVESGARLDWLPQETILYDRASLDRSLRIDLQGDASCLLVETLVFGRSAMGETIRNISLSDRIAVWRDGAPLFVDRTHLSGNAALHLERRAIATGGIAIATVLLATAPDRPDASAHLDKLRPTLPRQAGISLIRPGLLLLRMVAPDSFVLRQTLLPVLAQLNDGPLPRTWMI